MTLSKKAFHALFAIIITEGYIVLSSELLAIRVTMPFIGSGTDTVSIIIAAVLLPLSFGYYFGGQFKPYTNKRGQTIGIRRKLANNILISAVILLPGLSYAPITYIMTHLVEAGIVNRLALTAIYSLLFLVTPVFLLGQTIPLVSNYFSKEKLSQITGKILFFSTIGSFLGATFSTLVLMATIGVHYTASLNFLLLAVLFFVLGRKESWVKKIIMIVVVILGMAFNSGSLLKALKVVENNQYNVIRVFDTPGGDARVMSLNHNSDSLYSPTTNRKHAYINFMEMELIYSKSSMDEPMNILVIGAGGFTLGLEDDFNIYHFVDIDGSLKNIAEKDFLQKKLDPNKIFHPVSAEAFLIEGDEKYDLIVMDAYQGDLTIPENLITQDFFQRAKNRLAKGGIVTANFILNPAFGDAFSRNLDSTFRSVFPSYTRQVIGSYNGWDTKKKENIVYIYNQHDDENNLKIYTDDKNTSYYDKPKSK